jgi:hypothetical protein
LKKRLEVGDQRSDEKKRSEGGEEGEGDVSGRRSEGGEEGEGDVSGRRSEVGEPRSE